MLKKEVAEKIKSFGFDVDKLIEAIKDKAEVDYSVPELVSAADLETRDANTKAEGKREGIAEGKTAGMEIASKAIAKKFNLSDTIDKKVLDKVIEAVSASVASGDDGLKEQVRLLQIDKEALVKEKEELGGKFTAAENDRKLISLFPANRSNNLDDEETLMLVKKAITIETIDGKEVVKKNGEVLRNPTTKDPLPIKDAITTLFAERKWVSDGSGGAGRGGNNSNTGGGSNIGGIKSFSAAQEQWLKENPSGNIISPEATNYIAAIAKDVTDFEWHK